MTVAAATVLLRPRRARGGSAWLALLALTACGAGATVGAARLAAIDAGAARGSAGERASTSGYVSGVPRRQDGEVSVELETEDGPLLVRAHEPVPELAVGSEVRAEGVLAAPEPWRVGWLRRRGIAIVLEARRMETTGSARAGLAGRLDSVRSRAEKALGRGMPEREQALARGFVLGQDDRIDARTVEEFKRSGLAHLLAVSGQNVLLLCLLAWPLLALAGLTLRARLVALLLLIAVYVPVTGAGPSIQRAGVMGAAGVVAGLAGRARASWYALLLAAAVTLALNPRASGDVGWQLSFAATGGILLTSSRLAALIAGDAGRGSARRALAEGGAVTLSATVATAPLMAHHFDAFSLAALPANLLALPAVAPAMWLGMLAGIAGQIAVIPVEPLNWINSLLLAYIAQVARWLAAPGWAQVELGLGSPAGLAAAYGLLLGLFELALGAASRRRGLRLRGESASARPRVRGRGPGPLAAAVAITALLLLLSGARSGEPRDGGSLRVRVLDVGQGDSILLDPPGREAALVDAGPAEAEVDERLRELGLSTLSALIVTHDQADHAGGAPAVIEALGVDRLGYGRLGPGLRAAARAAGSELVRLAEGSTLRLGELRLEVLWPPAEVLRAPAREANGQALVLLAEWRHFSLLLCADAEAEAVPLDPGAVDVLKVAHHGSEDAGLGPLLDRTVPKLAVISVGAGNPYGHPTAQALGELRERSIPVLRTDRAGAIAIEAGGTGWSAGVD